MSRVFIYFLIALLGVACGVLLNYLADVLPARRKLVHPFCINCGKDLPWFAYIAILPRCPNCGKPRSNRNWTVLILSLAATLWLWSMPPARLGFFPGLILLIYFGLVVIIDIEHRLIMHPVSLVGALLTLVIGIWLRGPLVTLAGGVAGLALMGLFYFLGLQFTRLIYRAQGKTLEEGLGFGDVILSGVLGLLFGWPAIILVLFLGVLLGAVIGLLYILLMAVSRQFKAFATMPYGPFLVASAVVLFYFRDLVLGILNR